MRKVIGVMPLYDAEKKSYWIQPRYLQMWGMVCDSGRKLENLRMPVNLQCCAATDGSTSLNVSGRHI